MKKKRWWLACLPLWLAAVLGLWRLDAESIWHDEAWSIRAIESPFGTPDDKTPFLYYASLHLLYQAGGGASPFALRYGSVLIFLLGVALVYRLGQNWTDSESALAVGLGVATSPLLWEYAQEVRAYIAVPLWALVFLASAERLIRRPFVSPLWLWVTLAQVAALYTHNLSVTLVLWLNGVLGLAWLGGRRWSVLGRWGAVQGLVLLAYLPWLLSQAPSGTALNTVPTFNAQWSQDLWRGYLFPLPVAADDLPPRFTAYAHVYPFLVGLSAVFLAWRGRSARFWLTLSQVIFLPVFFLYRLFNFLSRTCLSVSCLAFMRSKSTLAGFVLRVCGTSLPLAFFKMLCLNASAFSNVTRILSFTFSAIESRFSISETICCWASGGRGMVKFRKIP